MFQTYMCLMFSFPAIWKMLEKVLSFMSNLSISKGVPWEKKDLFKLTLASFIFKVHTKNDAVSTEIQIKFFFFLSYCLSNLYQLILPYQLTNLVLYLCTRIFLNNQYLRFYCWDDTYLSSMIIQDKKKYNNANIHFLRIHQRGQRGGRRQCSPPYRVHHTDHKKLATLHKRCCYNGYMHFSTSYSSSNLHCFLTDRHGHAVKKKRQKSELSKLMKIITLQKKKR